MDTKLFLNMWEGVYVHLQLIHVVIQGKLPQHFKAIVLKKKKEKKEALKICGIYTLVFHNELTIISIFSLE